jgi:hypothetical protein
VDGPIPQLAVLAGGGLVAGLTLLARGFGGYRTANRIGDSATSRIASIAAGEVRVLGVVAPAEVLLVSALQSAPCVYYRSTVRERGNDDLVLTEERAVGFRVRDETGEVRVFPRAARWDVPARFDDRSSVLTGSPAGLYQRTGPAYAAAEPDRDDQVRALLGVDRPDRFERFVAVASGRDREYQERRLEPGDTVTIVGRAMPFGELDDPAEADLAESDVLPADDPEVAASIAEARAAGMLLGDPEEAWGNAAIPGFGIDRPVREPELDPGAARPNLAAPEEAARVARTFEIPAERLVLAAAPDVPLLIGFGGPGEVAGRHRATFLLGLLGAVLAIGSAIALAVALGQGLGT